jgi:hypothetical protein
VISKGKQIVHKLSSNICESMNSLKTKYMPKRLNMRVQYILRINMTILAKHIPGFCNYSLIFEDWRQKLLKSCDLSSGEKTMGFLMEQIKKKRKYQQIKNSEETKRTRLIKTATKRRKMNSNSPDKYKGKSGTSKSVTVQQLKEMAKINKISIKGLKKKADIQKRVEEGLGTLCWVEIPLMSDFALNGEGEFF